LSFKLFQNFHKEVGIMCFLWNNINTTLLKGVEADMQVHVRGKNISVTDALKEYAEKKVRKLEKYFNNYGDAQVVLSVQKDSHKVEVTIPINGIILRGEETTGDMYASVDLVVDKLEKQVERYKGRLLKREREVAGQMFNNERTARKKEEDEEPRIVRTKRFAVKPMPTEEAIMQMNLLNHSFFVFRNAETEEVNVLYRRKDGNYGLIEPE